MSAVAPGSQNFTTASDFGAHTTSAKFRALRLASMQVTRTEFRHILCACAHVRRLQSRSRLLSMDLDSVIVSIKLDHPNDGGRLVIGHLAAHSILVPRARVCAAIHRVNPDNTALRRSIALRRRVYHVDGPN